MPNLPHTPLKYWDYKQNKNLSSSLMTVTVPVHIQYNYNHTASNRGDKESR